MQLLRRHKLAIFAGTSLLAILAITLAAQLLPSPWTLGAHVMALVSVGAWAWVAYRNLSAAKARERVILDISYEMARKAEVGDLLDYVVQASLSLVPLADKCVIHLLDEQGRRLHPRYSSSPSWHEHLGLPTSKGIAAQALRERRTIVIDDVLHNDRFLPLDSGTRIRALLVAPLQIHSTVLGTLSLNSSRPGAFTENDERMMTIVATQLSSALHQFLLHEKTKHHAQYADSLLHNLPCGIALVDDDKRLVHYNPALAHILGPNPDQIVGRRVSLDSDHASLRTLARLLGPDDATEKRTPSRHVELPAPTNACLSVTVAEMPTITGRQETIAMVIDETTQQTTTRELGALLKTAAQEIIPGLDAIRGYASLLGAALSNEAGPKGWAAEIQTKSGELADRARDLSFLRDDYAGALVSHPRPLELAEVVAEWQSLFEPQAQARGINLLVTLDDDLAQSPSVDLDKLDHAMRNLLSDALSRGYRDGQISLSIAASEHDLHVTVQDNGRALTTRDHNALLHGWSEREDMAYTPSSGTALALHVAKRLAQAMGGHLWIEQDANLGVKTQMIVPL